MQQAWTIAQGLQCACKKRIAEKGKKPKGKKIETTAVVQGVMVDTWKYEDETMSSSFGHEVSADVQRRETHNCISVAS